MLVRQLPKAAIFAFLFVPVFLFTQEISSTEEQRLDALVRAQAEVYIPRNRVDVGFRVLSSGANVHFGNLGNVPFGTTQDLPEIGAVNRIYDNGYVNVDTPRSNEVDHDGIQT